MNLKYNALAPIYYLILMLPLKFNYSIFTVRFIPLIFGFFSLFLIFLIIKRISKNSLTALLGTFLLSIDMNFLCRVRFGRADSTVLFFNLWLVFLYLKYLSQNNNKLIFKKLIPMFIISILGIFTHFLIGSIATITIICHQLINRIKLPKLIIIGGILGIILEIIFITLTLMGINVNEIVIANHHIIPTFHPTILIIFDFFTQNLLNFIIYFLSAVIFLVYSKKSRLSWFWALFCFVSLIIAFIGDSYFYIFLIPASFIVLLAISEIQDVFGVRTKRFCICGLVIMSIFQHSRIIKHYNTFNYYSFGKKLSDCVERQNANLIIGHIVSPDPFLYFVEKRKDLKLSYTNMNHYQDSYIYAFSKADYLIYPAQSDIDPQVSDLIKKYEKDVCLVKDPNNIYHDVAVFKFK